MRRLFNEHKTRKVIELSGAWSFAVDCENNGVENNWYNGIPGGETVMVPSCWNNELRLLNYEGAVWYQKSFETDGGAVMLEFESVMSQADVWVDGVKVGDHYGAFTPFQFIIDDLKCGEHLLVVRVDNVLNEKSFPQKRTDWFNYGGIARDAYAHVLKGLSIVNNHIVYTLSKDLKEACVCADMELYNATGAEITDTVTVTVGDKVIYSGDVTLGAYERKSFKTPEAELCDIELWSCESPKLYTSVASTSTDDLIEKVGFRFVEVKNLDILLNGKKVELLGVNRHDEHPDWGFAFPAKLMKKDLDLVLEMGCNTIRGSHYPNSRIFLDMLDERGILFWSEIPMWGVGFSEKTLTDEFLMERGFKMHKEMVKYYYNHPAIVIWGMHNEIPTYSKDSYPVSEKWSKYLRANGGNRLITHASCHPMYDCDMDFDDIISINIYHGWYTYGGYNGNLGDWNKMIEQFGQRRIEKGWENKPVIMSEFGAAALAGYHCHFDTVRWSEEYQRDLIEYCLELFHKTDYMRGTYIWQFCNIRTSPTMDINRVRYFNNKGLLDEYRNPKAAFFKVKELYTKFAKEGK